MRAIVFIQAAKTYEKVLDRSLIQLNPDRTYKNLPIQDKVIHESFLPTYEEMEEVDASELKFYFIQPSIAKTFITPEDKILLDSYQAFDWVEVSTGLIETLNRVSSMPEYDDILILDFSMFGTIFNLLHEAQLRNSEKFKFFMNLDQRIDLNELLSDEIEPSNNYDLFSMKTVNKQEDDYQEIISHIKILTEILIKYIKADFHTGKIDSEVTINWELNLSIPEMDMFIRHFNLYPPIEDQRQIYRYHFMGNAQYRKIVTQTLAKFIANFMKNNGMVKKSRSETQWYRPSSYVELVPKSSI